MAVTFTPIVLPLLVAAAICARLAWYAWTKRGIPGAVPFALIMVALTEWPLAYALVLAGTDLPTKLVWYRVEYLGVAALGAAWVMFIVEYGGWGTRLQPWHRVVLLIEPAVTVLMAWTNDAHGWLWATTRIHQEPAFVALDVTFGWWYWMNMVLEYGMFLIGAAVLAWALIRRRRLYRLQAGSLVLGLVVPIIGNSLYNAGLVAALDPAPFAFAISGLIWWWGLLHYRVLTVAPVATPVALESIFDDMVDGVLVVDTAGQIVKLNPAAERILGQSAEQAIGQLVPDPLLSNARDTFADAREASQTEIVLADSGTERAYDLRLSPLRHREGALAGQIVALRDITERKKAEEAVAHQARHDALTGLPNRTMMRDQLALACAAFERQTQRPALLFLDLDNFKTVNDSLGHLAGDELLVLMAQRLEVCLRASDLAARLGGDEFGILLGGAIDEKVAADVAERIIETFGAPFRLSRGSEVFITASLGIALCGPNAADPETLLRNADAAMYSAKALGKGRFAFFHDEMHRAAQTRLELERDLRHALERGEFQVHYQPIVELKSGRLTGCEALVRWMHPERGMVSPLDFIPLAEEIGLIVPLGRWVLEEACQAVRDWQLYGDRERPITVTVNVSPRQLQDPGFVDDVLHVLSATEAAPSSLILEITEGILLDQSQVVLGRLQRLREMGLKLALDDFGTGYSAMGYLQRLPIDLLKIDRSFVQGLGISPERVALIRAIIMLGQAFGLRQIAEGVERTDQLRQLQLLGCEFGQGFLFSKPQPRLIVDGLVRRELAGIPVWSEPGLSQEQAQAA
jgi:diguanylate cyclase (GGDEF)-like protein/PAS domain S-box-containing protein